MVGLCQRRCRGTSVFFYGRPASGSCSRRGKIESFDTAHPRHPSRHHHQVNGVSPSNKCCLSSTFGVNSISASRREFHTHALRASSGGVESFKGYPAPGSANRRSLILADASPLASAAINNPSNSCCTSSLLRRRGAKNAPPFRK